jgi:hypothetical protein
MTQITTAQIILRVLRDDQFNREAALLDKAINEFESGSSATKRNAAGRIHALCSVRGLTDLNIKSMDHNEWESLLIKLDKKIARKCKQIVNHTNKTLSKDK